MTKAPHTDSLNCLFVLSFLISFQKIGEILIMAPFKEWTFCSDIIFYLSLLFNFVLCDYFACMISWYLEWLLINAQRVRCSMLLKNILTRIITLLLFAEVHLSFYELSCTFAFSCGSMWFEHRLCMVVAYSKALDDAVAVLDKIAMSIDAKDRRFLWLFVILLRFLCLFAFCSAPLRSNECCCSYL